MDFTVVDDIKEKAATVSELAEKAKDFADKGLDAAKNFVCVEILTIYQMAYATAGQVIAIPYMAIKMAKKAIKLLDNSVVQGAQDTFGNAVATLMTTYTNTTVKYDPETGRCTTETKPSKIQSDPSYVQQALHAMKAAKNCPLLDSVTSTSGFKTAFNLTKLLAAMENTSADAAAAAFANALTDLATGMVANLADSLKDTAFGKLKEAKKMYKAALQQSGVEELFKLMGIGQSCLMDLCDDRAVLLELEDMPLTPYLEKAGGFVEEKTEKINSSYFTFTFDMDKSTGADKLSEEQQIDTTLYEPLPVITGIKFTTAGTKSIQEILGEPYYTYYKNFLKYVNAGGKDDYQMLKKLHLSYDYSDEEVAPCAQHFFIVNDSLSYYWRSRRGYVEYTRYKQDANGNYIKGDDGKFITYVERVPYKKLNEGGFQGVADSVHQALSYRGAFSSTSDVCFKIIANPAEETNPILSALVDADFIFICTEPGKLENMNDGAAYCPFIFSKRQNCSTSSDSHIDILVTLVHKYQSCPPNEPIPNFFDTYTTADLKSNTLFYYFTDDASSSFNQLETTGAYTLFPFKKK